MAAGFIERWWYDDYWNIIIELTVINNCPFVHTIFFLEIEIPKEYEVQAEEEEDEQELLKQEDSWNDLGLSEFLQETNGQNADPKWYKPVPEEVEYKRTCLLPQKGKWLLP